MIGYNSRQTYVTGIGVATPIGIGIKNFSTGLKKGETHFSVTEISQNEKKFTYPIAKLEVFDLIEAISTLNIDENILKKVKRIRNLTLIQQYGLFCALEAWSDANIDKINPNKVAIIVSGSNLQNNYFHEIYEQYNSKLSFINPNYGLNFLDSDIVGIISEVLGIKGEGYTIGAASASGNLALIQAHRLICSGEYDAALVVATPMDLSIFEMQALTSLGAMATVTDSTDVNKLCCPFDESHCGFVFGQNGGCIVLESAENIHLKDKQNYGTIAGYGIVLDGNRNPNPSLEGEKQTIIKAVEMAGIQTTDIDYINTHGTASIVGDKTEVDAIIDLGFENKLANSTKSLIGHGITSAGLVEAIACFVQMNEGFIHTTANLKKPITNKINWVQNILFTNEIKYVLNNSFGFGGVNTSIVFKNNNI